MSNMDELQKRYMEDIKRQQEQQLSRYKPDSDRFVNRCKQQFGIDVEIVPSYGIGVTASYPNIIKLLLPDLMQDKDGLVSLSQLDELGKKCSINGGYYVIDDYMVFVHHYFRRGYCHNAVFAPLFLHKLWKLNNPNIIVKIAMDMDRVRVHTDNCWIIEEDTWYGAPFNQNIDQIKDGASKLVPTAALQDCLRNWFYPNIYAFYPCWSTDNNKIRVFEAEDFMIEDVQVEVDSRKYHPGRYVHAEYDPQTKTFRHLDGAIHLYDDIEYAARKDLDLNYSNKLSKPVKAKSVKLFRMDGTIPVDIWSEFVTQFYTGDPLVKEYFLNDYIPEVKELLNFNH